jgi:drug/metabolite transporter (DMT)-like permease
MMSTHGVAWVSALLLLVPPLTPIEAWLLFIEQLIPLQLLGFAGALGGGVVMAKTRSAA